ncbi:MAG: hypothetical protein MUF49_12765 [Oculatellaceae cyanobacterium Prado106]|jgi:hypothetical protein|nr:hypothetical protein [Oculatellaceae cyanobacterium Prado106]
MKKSFYKPAFYKSIPQIIAAMLVLALVWLLSWQSPAPAQSVSQLDSRLSRLEADTTALRSSVNRVENQLARLSNQAGIEYPRTTESDRPSGVTALADDPTFKRLATLVIELRERIVALEERLPPAR